MSASVSPTGFGVVRGRDRGYRPEQVDRVVARLAEQRDETWERAARLTAFAGNLEEEAARLKEQLAALPPQTYESLGPRAELLLSTAEAEAAELRETAEAAARQCREEAETAAASVREAAREYAEGVRGEAETWAGQCRVAAQRVAEDVRVTARRDAKEWRAEAVAGLKEARQRTEELEVAQEKELAARWDEAGREEAEREAAMDTRIAELVELGERSLAQAQQRLSDVAQSARQEEEVARRQAAEVLERARASERRVAEETEGVLREHAGRREEVCRHLEHVRGSLAALSGGRLGEATPVPGPAPSSED
ncbi:cellulose-binding protein [Streptomyces pathocidini]|uniref:cellulose-binding protein n=1 Tax=Streptomyces pathocidini TaxID=1650571 RepID=UPI0033EF8173